MILVAMYLNFSYNNEENTVEITKTGKTYSRSTSEKVYHLGSDEGRGTIGSES
jgi:hypothetical protein